MSGIPLAQEDVIKKLKSIHGDLYNYSQVVYINAKTKIKIECSIHGVFEQTVSDHSRKDRPRGCPTCGASKCSITNTMSTEEFIQRAKEVHGDEYDYTETLYIRHDIKVKIKCIEHGDFFQNASNHINNAYGCILCGFKNTGSKLRKNKNDYINSAINKHGEKYSYEFVDYKNMSTPIVVVCQDHGKYNVNPSYHLRSFTGGCKDCARKSTIENRWLDSIGLPNTSEYRNVCIDLNDNIKSGKIVTDGFDEIANTVYEFWGDFWHGNPDVFDQTDINKRTNQSYSELYAETQLKRKRILDAGYNLIEIWENDFRKILREQI